MRAIVTVIGKDRVGIIADVCSLLASNSVNILDISQTVMRDYFTMIMLVEAPEGTDFSALSALLDAEGEKTGLKIRIQREEIFEAMHRI
ncbi:MAG: ACT domain-containing protein [Oscillospiraceae bacterium]|nr:ACT domain-containing protein [Oscillospiraceae bacterium]